MKSVRTLIAAATSYLGRTPDRFEFRGVHPMFHDADLRIVGVETHDGLDLCTAKDDAHQGMSARAIWEDKT